MRDVRAGCIDRIDAYGDRRVTHRIVHMDGCDCERRKKNDLARDLTSLVMIQKPTSCDGTPIARAVVSDTE